MEKSELIDQLHLIIDEISKAGEMSSYVDKPYEYLQSTIEAIHKRLEMTVNLAEDSSIPQRA